ncbi:sulfatase [Rhodobacteraceae bacterium MCCB 386]|nr:sulfatase [Roseitranquillus sediminis]
MTARPARNAGALALAALTLHLVLIQPNHPAAMTWQALFLFPLELPAILALLIAVPADTRVARGVRLALVAVLMAIALHKLADFGTYVAYNRRFNIIVDLHLAEAGWRLASGAVGTLRAAVAVAALLAMILLATAALWWSTGRWAALTPSRRVRAGAAVFGLTATLFAAAEVGHVARHWRLPFDPPGTAFTARVAWERVTRAVDTLAELRDFAAAARRDPFADAGPLLDRVGDRDILLLFIESYGRSSLENPLYAPTHRQTLATAERELREAGLAMRSGWLTAPMSGGQSWLAHATVGSGLWISDQTRYRAMLASPRRTLAHVAAESGYRTAVVMPAITLDWPEVERMGFETVLPATELGYLGQPFNWVTMPDQYTLTMLDRLVRNVPDPRPVFAQAALISSHAPWVPIPPMIPWDDVGDGRIFDAWATSGDPPAVVWRDRDRVRDQYRQAIDYSLQAVTSYALRQADRAALMVVLGDHQPAGFVAQSDSLDVPIHVIGPPDLVERVDDWGWTPGLIPAADAPVWRMDAFRDRFLAAFSSAAP